MANRMDNTQKLKDKYGVDIIYSFSRINCYKNCSYSFYLKYIKHIKGTNDSIYAVLGTQFHDLLEKLYNNEVKQEDLPELCDNIILNAELSDLRFNKSDKEKNDAIANKYYACIRHFFSNHKLVTQKVISEQEIVIKIKDNIFRGFVDAIHKDGDNYIITDYKTSTIYTGDKISKEGNQLALYALGLHQKGVSIDKIKIRWEFLKYISVSYQLKNGKTNTSNYERHCWVAKLSAQLRKVLKELGNEDFIIDMMINESINNNSIDNLPDEVRAKFTLTDCYVYIPFNQEVVDNLINDLDDTIKEIESLKNTNNEDLWNKDLTEKETYWCGNLCEYTASQCRCYKNFLENSELFKKENNKNINEDWLKELSF